VRVSSSYSTASREDYYLREHPAFIQGYFHDVQRRHAFLYIDKADYHGIVAPGSSIRQRRHQAVLQPNCGWLSPTQRSWLSPTWILDGHKSSDHRFPKDDTRSKQHLRQNEIKSVGNDLIFSCDGAFASSKIFRSEFDGYGVYPKPPTRRLSSRVSFRLKACRSSRNAHLFAIIWKCISATIYRSS
jgi:hypothetical protein